MMADDIKRDGKGRFPPKQSGNRRGRPPKRRIDPKLPAARRDVIMRVADRLVDVKVDGKGTTERMSLYEANVFQLAVSGAGGSRVSAQKFIELAMSTSEQDLLMGVRTRLMIDRMNATEDELHKLKQRTGQVSGVVEMPKEYWDARDRYDNKTANELLRQRLAGTLPGLRTK